MKKLFQVRKEYNAPVLYFNELLPNPMEQFDEWFKKALKTEKNEPNAMALATTGIDLKPSVRFVLLKAYDERGFVFFTNYESRKSIQISQNPYAAITLFWPLLQQQIRAEGELTMLPEFESDDYFNDRPNGSKIGAWASPQSKPIPSREYLEKLKGEYEKIYSISRIPRPKYWGGYRLIPNMIEFWQGRPDRLHDRFEYKLINGCWKKERLAP